MLLLNIEVQSSVFIFKSIFKVIYGFVYYNSHHGNLINNVLSQPGNPRIVTFVSVIVC